MRAGERVCSLARTILFLPLAPFTLSVFSPPRRSRVILAHANSSLAPNSRFRGAPPARLEPFTPCWVSHRNLLKACCFHPRGSNHRRENPADPRACRNGPDTFVLSSAVLPFPLFSTLTIHTAGLLSLSLFYSRRRFGDSHIGKSTPLFSSRVKQTLSTAGSVLVRAPHRAQGETTRGEND